jgi:hypothetical protein
MAVDTMKAIATTLLLASVTLTSAATNPSRSTQPDSEVPQQPAERVALQAISDRLGARADGLTIVAQARASFPSLGRTILEFKIRDAGGRLYGIGVDEKLQAADPRQPVADERANRKDALDRALAERLEQFPSQKQRVLVWATDRTRDRVMRPPLHGDRWTAEQVDSAYARIEGARIASLTKQMAPLLERLHRVDPEARAVPASPIVGMTANAEGLAKLAQDPDIDRIYLDEQNVAETGEVAKVTTGIATLHLGGAKGTGVRIALTEAEGRVETGSLLLNTIIQDATNVCAMPSDHTTEVASIVKGRRITLFGTTAGLEGAAPNVELRVGGSCSNNSVELMDASSRAATWGARAISMSWGHDTQLVANGTDRFYDDLTFNRWRTVVKSAGNRGCATPGEPLSGPGGGLTTTPGLGFNVITVGGFDDHDTPTWSDDSIYVCTSFANPISTHSDREKPELSAPAVNLTVTTVGPANMTIASGTSGASPLVVSAVALLIERNSRLAIWPEITRAVLMATATHNIEGSSRLSDIDGAGGLNAGEAMSLAQDSQRTGGRWYTCDASTATPLDLITLTVGRQTRQRVVISWDTDPSYANYGNEPSADIDLEVVDPQGRVVASSRSFDGTNEIVEFDTPLAGTFTVRAVKFRCDLSTWLGWAWHTTSLRLRPSP